MGTSPAFQSRETDDRCVRIVSRATHTWQFCQRVRRPDSFQRSASPSSGCRDSHPPHVQAGGCGKEGKRPFLFALSYLFKVERNPATTMFYFLVGARLVNSLYGLLRMKGKFFVLAGPY